MSYCRFSEGDAYMFEQPDGRIICMACNLADLTPSIFTTGYEDHPLFGDLEPCEECGGDGCKVCMMHDNLYFDTKEEALAHLEEHIANGDHIPKRALFRLKKEMEESNQKTD